MPDIPLPPTYRAEVIEPLIALIEAGESCSIVGIGSSGKSNLTRFLTRADVRLHYFGAEAAQTFALYVNCKECALHPPYELYLHLFDKLVQSINELDGVFTAVLSTVNALLKDAETRPELLAKRNLDRAIDQIFRQGAKHLILILDDCDDLFAKAPPYLFSDLRSIRDNHKLLTVYVTTSRRELVYLRMDTPEYEEMFELFSAPGHTIPLPPYSEADSIAMVHRLATRQDPPRAISAAEARRMYELSGGHAGLLHSIFFAVGRGLDLMAADIVERLVAKADVEAECKKVWDSLEPEERGDLRCVLARENSPPDGLRRLERRGLIRLRFTLYPEFVSPVFARFVSQVTGVAVQESIPIEFVGAGCQVRIYGQLISNLIRPEYEILRCLVAKRPNPCLYGELVEIMRLAEQADRSMVAHGSPLRRLEQYVQQLKAKIGPASVLIQSTNDGYCMSE